MQNGCSGSPPSERMSTSGIDATPGSGRETVRVVVFGANGVFGRRTLRRLSSISTLELGAVCRTKEQALLLTKTLGPRVTPLWGNVHRLEDVQALSRGAQAIFHCAGPFSMQPLYPLTVALEDDLDYADLGDDPTYLKTATERIEQTSRNDRLTICGASSLPSMTSLLALLAQSRFGAIDKIDIHVFIGNRNPKGRGAIEYLIHALRHAFMSTQEGRLVPNRSWQSSHSFLNPFDHFVFPFSRIESPDDHFLPGWFNAKTVAFWVSLQFAWIHHVISLIGMVQRQSPAWLDSFWVNFLFYGHPIFLKQFGSSQGWLHLTTTHQTSSAVQTVHQQFSADDEGQRVPSFPLTIIGKIIAGELPRPEKSTVRFIDLLTPEQFLVELRLEGIQYQIAVS